MASLTERQRRFLDALATDRAGGGADWNATVAARIAGYSWPGKQGSRLLAMPHVAAEARRRREAMILRARQRWAAERRGKGM